MADQQIGAIFTSPVAISSATTTHQIAAVSGARIVVLSLNLSLSGTNPTMKFQDTTGSPVVLTGTFDATGVYPFNGSRQEPLFATSKGTGLDIVTTGTPTCNGVITYTLEFAD